MRINSSIKHSHIASVVSSSVTSATPLSSSGSSKSNSSLGIKIGLQIQELLESLCCWPTRPHKVSGQVLLHRVVFGVGRHAVGAGLPRAAPLEAAVFGFRHADQTL